MNIVVPDMLQNALTEKMSVKDAANDAAQKIEGIIGGIWADTTKPTGRREIYPAGRRL